MIGQKVNNYVINRLLGEGGMGAVYLAEHPFLGRKAAIKILKPECASNSDYVQRFLNEARAANAIHHPNIIDIIDVGILPEGVPYMMMEFLQGESLAERLRRVIRFPLGEAVFVASQIASALSAAHAASIIHRDLKPDNVFVVPDAQNPGREHIKVLDFGIAKLRPEFAPSTPRTSAGALMGTPAYMSPEQCMGKTSEIDHRADIYALGVILFEMLCGRLPFQGQAFGEYFIQHITTPPPPPRDLNPEIPVHVEAVILKALEKEAKDRIQTMDALAELLAGRPIPATLVLDESPLDEEQSPRPGRGKHRSEPRIGRTAHSSHAGAASQTTLSSTTGQMPIGAEREEPARGGHRITMIVGAAIALCAMAVVGGVALSRRTDSLGKQAPSAKPRIAEPVPAFSPPPVPTEPASTPTRLEAQTRKPRPIADGKNQTEEASGQDQPEGKRPPSARERGKTRSGTHGDSKSSRLGGRHEKGGGLVAAPESPPANPVVIPSAAPAAISPSSPSKIITREKF